jgi:tetratricopeptide (TPR) repeat protein
MPPRRRLSPKARRILWRTLLAIVAIIIAWCAWKYWLKPWLFPPSPLVRTPQIGFEQLQAKSLYYNGDARALILKYRPDLLPADDRGEVGPRYRGFAQATQEPRIFRLLDRQYRFDTILLIGDRSHFQLLLDHLIEPEPDKRDFRLVYLDHWMFVFKRGAPREWQISDADALKARMKGLRSEDRAAFIAKTGERMLAVGLKDAAKQWLDEALALDSSSVEALTGMADYYTVLAKWPEAESFADKALEEQENYAPALQRKFLALVGRKYVADAFKMSEKIMKAAGENPSLLWQHAKIARLAEKYDAEIAALARLIALAEAGQRITSEYEFRLGEAHALAAQQDLAHMFKAEEHFRKAIADPALPQKMRETAFERLQTIAKEKAKNTPKPPQKAPAPK